jgi:hypothetical protein
MQRFIAVFLLFVFLFALPTVSRADAYNNLSTCLQGFDYGCRHDLLTQEEAGRVRQAEHDYALNTCLQGFDYGCRHDLLTQEEAGRVRQAEHDYALSTCLQGFGYGCRHDLLTQEEAGRVRQAEAGKSTAENNYQTPTLTPSVITPSVNTGGRNYSPHSYSLQQQRPPTYAVPCAENGSCYGDISSITGIPKTVSVQGYFRRDGTYVRGHYRSHR